ncbi:hypothetical protein OG689_42370 [Kitasatospora sp. NBC_00240]|uniref:hypothetical protein n=1 Tax=Kitasatospora sp. NBC_00240 TaxID=2903567 RepID=UPI002253CAFA|nr:hypothetical protein [Kitasatospora sp. NBC_00240]MCX5215801.1 hypothetical protein [Kitasatospora sp. NBC_00240]
MRPDLADLLDSAARVLDTAGPLAPLHIAVSSRDIQVTFAPGVPADDQRSGIDRLAAATGARPVESNLGASASTYTVSAELANGALLVAGTHPALRPSGSSRTTSTAEAVTTLRALGPWARTLDTMGVPVWELGVDDDCERLSVRLTVDSGGDPDAALVSASAGVDHLRPARRTAVGLDRRGRLPSGQPVLICAL